MIFLSYGNTKSEVKKKLEAEKLLNELNEIHSIDPTTWSEESVDELMKTQGLFATNEIFFVDHVISELGSEEILKNVKLLKGSPNLIIFLEDTQTADTKKLEEYAEHILQAQKLTIEKTFNIFILSDAIFEKDKKKLWLLLEKCFMNGLDGEEIYRILFWAVKMLALAQNYSSATTAGISPFVFKKAKQGVSKYSANNISRMAQSLSDLIIQARQGGDWEMLLEKFALSL